MKHFHWFFCQLSYSCRVWYETISQHFGMFTTSVHLTFSKIQVSICEKMFCRFFTFQLCTYQCQAGRWGWGRRGIGRDFDRSLWPGGRAFELSCCPGGRHIWIFVRARDHKSFPGRGISVIFDLTFLPGGREFDSIFLENVKIPPYAPPTTPLRQRDIDRCIINRAGGLFGRILTEVVSTERTQWGLHTTVVEILP